VDVNKIETWDDFIRVGRQVTIPGQRYMIEMSDTVQDQIEVCLFQHGGGYFDRDGHCTLDNEQAVETMKFYVPLVAGKQPIGNSLGGGQILTKAVEEGYLVCLVAPDWRTKSIEQVIQRMAGKTALMPFPALKPGGPRTSTWGGTMLGITRHSSKQDLAWEWAMHLYTDKSQLGQRFRDTNILPALRDAWDQPAFQEPRPYWSNQKLGAVYAKLAPQVPYQYTSPYIRATKPKLGEALVDCVAYYKSHGEVGFDPYVRKRLRQSADEVRQMVARNPY